MTIEDKYDMFILDNYPEYYGGKEGMIRNWEQGFAFDHFADTLGITEQELIEEIS